MTKPTIELQKLAPGKFEIVVRNAMQNPELHNALVALGYTQSVDVANRMSVIVTSATELDAKRNPLRAFFA